MNGNAGFKFSNPILWTYYQNFVLPLMIPSLTNRVDEVFISESTMGKQIIYIVTELFERSGRMWISARGVGQLGIRHEQERTCSGR